MIPQGDSSLFSLRPGAVADARRVDAFEWYQQIGYGFDVSRDGAEILYLLKGDISGVLLNRVVIADRATAEFSSGFRLENDYSWNGAPKLSFDKTKIAIYAGYDSGEYRGVSVYDRAGDELFYFRTNLVNPYGIDWMPDGRLMFADGNDVYVVDAALNGASVAFSTENQIGQLSVRGDGKKVVFDADDGHIYSSNVDGSDRRAVTHSADEDGISEAFPTWSPDGQYIAFAVVAWAYGSSGGAGSTHNLALVKDVGETYTIDAQVVGGYTNSGSVAGDDLSGDGVLFVKKMEDGEPTGFNVTVGSAPVWR